MDGMMDGGKYKDLFAVSAQRFFLLDGASY